MSTSTTSSGIGCMGVILIMLIGFKLTDVIDWSWWWVLAPIWIQFVIFMVLAVIWLILKFIEDRKNN
jgi:hypothetical protein